MEPEMHVVILDGHPDENRLITSLLDHYEAALPVTATVERIAVRLLNFDPNLRSGYGMDQPWEPDLERFGEAIVSCDHLVVGFPLWWGAEPMLLKGVLDRILLPGFAFRYHRDDPFWDRLLAGRSADVIITMDTPPWYLRLVYGDPVARRWRRQVLGFCGFSPIRVLRLGPTRRGNAGKSIARWQSRIAKAAKTAAHLRRVAKSVGAARRTEFADAVVERQS
jgi:putative NADPH-quinone reductase